MSAFGIHQLPRAEQAARVAEVLQLVGLEGSENRYPTNSRAASSSAWPWPVPWRRARSSCCWTSPFPTWT